MVSCARLRTQPCRRSRSRSRTTGGPAALSPRPFLAPAGVLASLLGVCLSSAVHICLLSVWRRTKRTLGLGSLYGDNDLLDLDGDPLRERHVAEKQLAALGDIL